MEFLDYDGDALALTVIDKPGRRLRTAGLNPQIEHHVRWLTVNRGAVGGKIIDVAFHPPQP
ncbi:MAG TPA: hypothetical protein VFN25_07005 [Dokdonella sp.]|uniref:hypothetical protein n=1 Tax=Dokdonella sp. TaxID=2291710 RepID=UPI002D8070E5|nr:hypothetical protein [Dokdonella sp.]HET9032637.1 hypothetical protein [Dokdonella sp.]